MWQKLSTDDDAAVNGVGNLILQVGFWWDVVRWLFQMTVRGLEESWQSVWRLRDIWQHVWCRFVLLCSFWSSLLFNFGIFYYTFLHALCKMCSSLLSSASTNIQSFEHGLWHEIWFANIARRLRLSCEWILNENSKKNWHFWQTFGSQLFNLWVQEVLVVKLVYFWLRHEGIFLRIRSSSFYLAVHLLASNQLFIDRIMKVFLSVLRSC